MFEWIRRASCSACTLLAAMFTVVFAICTLAQQPAITLFESDGTLTWSNAYPGAFASIERLTDAVTTGSVATVTEALGISDGSTADHNYTVEHPPIVNPSVTISDGTYSWNDVTGYSTNPPGFISWADYSAGTVHASYPLHVPPAGTTIQVAYAYLPVSTTQEWLSVYSEQSTSQMVQVTVDMSEDSGLFRVRNGHPPLGMLLIPGGSNSGTNPLASGEAYSSWYPETYSLSAGSFYMDPYEVTNDEMVEVLQWAYDQNPPLITVSASTVQNAQGDLRELLDLDAATCRITWDGASFGMKAARGSGYPCIEVPWCGAVAYCNYRSEMERRATCYDLSDWSCDFSAGGYRLPTSDEWEYAARGGLVSKRFPWGDTISHSQANYFATNDYDYDLSSGGYHPLYHTGESPHTSPVGSFAENAWGLYDMSGNVWEWCTDYVPPAQSMERRLMRGGGYDGSTHVRVASWYPNYTVDSSPTVGFRTVLPIGR